MHERSHRAVVIVAVLALVAAGCRSGKQATNTPEPTSSPGSPAVESAGEFQLVATVEQAFVGEMPAVSIPGGTQRNLDVNPAPTGTGRETSPFDGVMRVRLEEFSDPLRDRCNADVGERFKLFWTTDTQFDRQLLRGDMEENLDRRRVGVIGKIFLASSVDQQSLDELGTSAPLPSGSAEATTPSPGPGLATTEGETKCILIAQQIGTSTGMVTTSEPRRTTRPPRTPTATQSPTPTPTHSPTPSPTPTESITPGPT